MISEIITASLIGTLPVAVFTFLILQWSIASGRLERFEKEDDIGKQYKKAAKAKKAAEKKARAEKQEAKKAGQPYEAEEPKPKWGSKGWLGNLFHDKVTSFGAGFYGTMAVLTYLVIEIDEVLSFIGKLGNLSALFSSLGIDLIVQFIINSIMNFIAAMIWFITLQDYLPINNGFIWLGAAYIGYLGGIRLVTQHGDQIWANLNKSTDQAGAWATQKASDFAAKKGLRSKSED